MDAKGIGCKSGLSRKGNGSHGVTEGFKELEFNLGCSMDYGEPPLKNGIND
jgi:hypothetical protein